MTVNVIGAGLAGCEAAYQLAKRKIKVNLYECKPLVKSPAHHLDLPAELVCSNSLKSDDLSTASGLLKAELRLFDCLLLKIAEEVRVPAGSALAVDRMLFSEKVSEFISQNEYITLIPKVCDDWNDDEFTIIATGPLTQGGISDKISEKLGENLHFFDAAAPIISADSIDFSSAFVADRYGRGTGDYVNCPMTKEEYLLFYEALITAERATVHEFDKSEIFEGCMPVEVMASRGVDTLRFGPLRPVGFVDNAGRKPYAVVQLRRENTAGKTYNLVGFQTNLKFGEQKRVFSMIPALKDAEFLRYGVMHRNSYINAPKLLGRNFVLKNHANTYIAGQLSGVEGYMESIMSGLIAGIDLATRLLGENTLVLPETSIMGALSVYLTRENSDFQPMNANFGVLPPLAQKMRDKTQNKILYGERSLKDLQNVCGLI